MRARIDALEKALKDDIRLQGVYIESYGDMSLIPEFVPYINIVPRRKERERSFVIGSDTLYVEKPEVDLEVIESSMEGLRHAFDKCEELVEKVLDVLADISSDALDVHHHESMVDEYDQATWESSYYYRAVILWQGTKDKTYT